jgi:hypothetical protein
MGEDAPVAENNTPSEVRLAVAIKPVIALPPITVGAVKVIDNDVGETGLAVPIVGGLGFSNGL